MNLSEIEFIPINPNNGHLGFVKFTLNQEWVFNHIAIHTLRDGVGIRLTYPALRGLQCVYPINKAVGDFITQEIQRAWFEFRNEI